MQSFSSSGFHSEPREMITDPSKMPTSPSYIGMSSDLCESAGFGLDRCLETSFRGVLSRQS